MNTARSMAARDFGDAMDFGGFGTGGIAAPAG